MTTINAQKLKRLDVVVKYFYPVTAGIETNIMNVYAYLQEQGFDVRIHASMDTPEERNILPQNETINGLKINRYPWRWYGFFPNVRWGETDAFCLHNFNVFPHFFFLATALFRKFFGIRHPKIFLIPHGGFTPGWETFPPSIRLVKKIYHKTLGAFLINRAVDALRSVSEWESQETIRYGVRKNLVTTIPNGLDGDAYRQDIEEKIDKNIRQIADENAPYIIQIGRIHPIKNQLTAIKALKYAPKQINFLIAGPVTDPEYKKLLDETIEHLGLNDRVRFIGVVSGIDKYYLLRKSLANVHMAIWESYCNAVHESMSQGCVCVVSKDTALEELVKDGINGFCIESYDDKAVAEKIRFLLDNQYSETIQKIRQNNLSFAQGHSWTEIAKKVEILYGNQILLV